MLRSLKMHGMAQAAAELTEQGAPAFQNAIPVLSQLLKAELAEREVRSIAYQLKAARFPTYKDLTGFDFASSQINEALVRQLHAGAFMEKADNIVLVGGPGTGKTHVATALGVQAVEHHRKRVRFTHHCHILETGNDSFRSRNSSATQTHRERKPQPTRRDQKTPHPQNPGQI
jgi:DNA replication protein DnaC